MPTSISIIYPMRYTGDKAERRDYEMTLDLWVPQGKDNCPLIMRVHGGSYNGGTNILANISLPAKRAMERGFAFASLNYVLGQKVCGHKYGMTIGVRFLRVHAEKFRLDPTKFCFGISAVAG